MNTRCTAGRRPLLGLKIGCLAVAIGMLGLVAAQAASEPNEIQIEIAEGIVEVSTDGGTNWVAAYVTPNHPQALKPFHQVRTRPRSRAVLRWADGSRISLKAETEIEILPPPVPAEGLAARLFQGVIAFFHRDGPGRIRIVTRGAIAGVDGTEFVMEVGANGATILSVIDGKVSLENSQGRRTFTSGQQAIAAPGQAPRLSSAGFVANNLVQWCFYYPGVLDPAELPLTPGEEARLALSLEAYRQGDVLAALSNYSPPLARPSPAEQVYLAALLLAVGEANEAEQLLAGAATTDPTGRIARLASALRQQRCEVGSAPG